MKNATAQFCLLGMLLAERSGFAQILETNLRIFQARGVVSEIDRAGKSIRLRHDAIPGYMPAMTMPFAVKDVHELDTVDNGDQVSFQINVTAHDGWVDHLHKLTGGRDTNLPVAGVFRRVRDIDPLKVGDPLPDYQFTNELGQTVSLHQFRCQALAITFVFTRCPFPTFCPRMSELFEETVNLLAKDSPPLSNVHFLTVSFDPEFDTPAQLKSYAEFHHYQPDRWNFLTGDLIDITALADSFGMKFWREGGGLSHNLRTAVIDANGRLQKVFIGNAWSSEELAAELHHAAQATNP